MEQNQSLLQRKKNTFISVLSGCLLVVLFLSLSFSKALAFTPDNTNDINVIGNDRFNHKTQSTATITSLENDTFNTLTNLQFEAICPDATNTEYRITIYQTAGSTHTATRIWTYGTPTSVYDSQSPNASVGIPVLEANSNGKVNTTAFTNAKVACTRLSSGTYGIRDLVGNVAAALHPNAQAIGSNNGLASSVIGSWVNIFKDNIIAVLGFLASFIAIGFIIRKFFGKLRS